MSYLKWRAFIIVKPFVLSMCLSVDLPDEDRVYHKTVRACQKEKVALILIEGSDILL